MVDAVPQLETDTRTRTPRLRGWLLRALLLLPAGVGLLVFGFAYNARSLADLKPWHIEVPQREPTARSLDAGMTLPEYLQHEARVFEESQARIAAALDPRDDVVGNRYGSASPTNPANHPRNWNRSFERIPTSPRGAVLLIHGMTDGPYSMRALADSLYDDGWHVLVLRMQGHGTVPAALLETRWQDWAATVRLGARHLRGAIGPTQPLLMIGYSTGGALVLQHQLEALDDDTLPRAQRLVLLSPLIGLPRSVRLAPLLNLLDGVPGLEKSAWLEVQPEYNPFKYNSFPINGGWQSWRLTEALSTQLERLRAAGALTRLPPLLSFHSVLDSTVLTDAVVHRLYDRLPANGSELVLYDLNRWNVFAPLLRPPQIGYLAGLLAEGRRDYALGVVTNVEPGSRAVHEVRIAAGGTARTTRALGLAFPPGVFSLSHIALPFRPDDPLYGLQPHSLEDFGVNLGTLALRGERHALQVPMEQLARLSCNPFYDHLEARVRAWADAATLSDPALAD